MNEITIYPIEPLPLPFELDAKIFQCTDEEGKSIGEPYSYNEWIQRIENISGVNSDFLGEKL